MDNHIYTFDEYINEGWISDLKDKIKSKITGAAKVAKDDIQAEFQYAKQGLPKQELKQGSKKAPEITKREWAQACQDNSIPYVIGYIENEKINLILHLKPTASKENKVINMKRYTLALLKFLSKFKKVEDVKKFISEGHIKDYIDFKEPEDTARYTSSKWPKVYKYKKMQQYFEDMMEKRPNYIFLMNPDNKWMYLECRDIYFAGPTFEKYKVITSTKKFNELIAQFTPKSMKEEPKKTEIAK